MVNCIPARIRRILSAGLLLLSLSGLRAQDMYWTPEARTVYGYISELRIEEGLNIARLQSITHPDNYIWPYLLDYGEFMKIFIREDLREVPDFMVASSQRLAALEQVPETNALSLMSQGQLYLHHCALHMQQGQFMAAATDINKAFKLLKKNQRLHPDDAGNLRLYASLKVVFGAIPDQYRWLISIVTSLSGTIDEGLRELHSILQTTTPSSNIFFEETVLYTAIAEGRLNNNPQAGLQLIYRYLGKTPVKRSVHYVMASLMIADGNNDGAIRILSQETGFQSGSRIPFLDFMLGECKLFRGDADADKYFKRFLSHHKGKHYIKEAYQKMAWHALLQGDRPGYFSYMQQILIKGSGMTDEDQQALHEAEYHDTPHPVLLRSRLYYDGGYYDKALALLTESFYATLHQHAHRLEFLYRKGRILQAQKAYAEALHYLNLTITSGQFEKYYFACSAALQSGIIHETLGSESAALKFYYMCLEMIPDTYATSLHQKARMGINRIE